MKIKHNTNALAMWLAMGLILSMIIGCDRPQAAPQNRELITSLRTAVSARKTDWLEQNVKILEERRAAGKVSDAEYEEFQVIIAKARAGKWEAAEREAIAFQKSQQPTREEIERVTRRRQ